MVDAGVALSPDKEAKIAELAAAVQSDVESYAPHRQFATR
jgi:hypothetical protein